MEFRRNSGPPGGTSLHVRRGVLEQQLPSVVFVAEVKCKRLHMWIAELSESKEGLLRAGVGAIPSKSTQSSFDYLKTKRIERKGRYM